MFKRFLKFICTLGIKTQIEELSVLTPLLTERFEAARKNIIEMDSKAMAQYLISEIQKALRERFNVPEEKR